MDSKNTTKVTVQSVSVNDRTGTAKQAPVQNGERLKNLLARPELVTFALLILAFIMGTLLSPYFLDIPFLLNYTSTYIEIGIMALGMVIALMVVVVPRLVEQFDLFDAQLPLLTRVVIGLSTGVREYGLLILLVLAVLIFGA